MDIIVDRLVRGKGRARAPARLDRVGVRQGAGPVSDPRGRRGLDTSSGAGDAADAGPSTSSPSRTCCGSTVPSAPARPARASAGSTELDLARIVPDPSKTIRQGAIAPWTTPAISVPSRGAARRRGRRIGIPVDVPFARLDAVQVGRLVEGVPGTPFAGLNGFFRRSSGKSYKLHVRVLLGRWRRYQTCPACQGPGYGPRRLAVRIDGPEHRRALGDDPSAESRAFLAGLGSLRDHPIAAGLLGQVDDRLRYLAEIGLDYLTLDRSAQPFRRASSSGSC